MCLSCYSVWKVKQNAAITLQFTSHNIRNISLTVLHLRGLTLLSIYIYSFRVNGKGTCISVAPFQSPYSSKHHSLSHKYLIYNGPMHSVHSVAWKVMACYIHLMNPLGVLVSECAQCSVLLEWPLTAEKEAHLDSLNHVLIGYVTIRPQPKPIIS